MILTCWWVHPLLRKYWSNRRINLTLRLQQDRDSNGFRFLLKIQNHQSTFFSLDSFYINVTFLNTAGNPFLVNFACFSFFSYPTPYLSKDKEKIFPLILFRFSELTRLPSVFFLTKKYSYSGRNIIRSKRNKFHFSSCKISLSISPRKWTVYYIVCAGFLYIFS